MSWPIPLETLRVHRINLETPTVLAYFFRDSKCFALII